MLDADPTSPTPTVRSPIPSRLGARVDGSHGRGYGRLAVSVLLPLPGCGLAPSVNVLGSFFPAWLICIVVGVVLTIVTQRVFVAAEVAPHLGPAALIYPCLAGLWIFATWLLLFGS